MNPATSSRLDTTSRLWALTATALCLLPLLLQLPATLAVSIAAAAVLVSLLSWRKPVPAILRLLLVLVVVAALISQTGLRFGRDTGCALLAAMLAIKPAETTSLRDARSLLGFAMFAPFAAFLLDQGPVSMLLGLLAIVSVFMALHRLADAEVQAHAPARSPLRQLGGVGKLMLVGLPLALAAFWLFPRLGSPLWGVPERAMAQPGLSDSMSPGEWIDLMADDSTALRAQFFGETPAMQAMYWRGPVLWDFDGRTWTQPPRLHDIPIEPFVPGPVTWDYQIEFEPTDRQQLVALDVPLAAPDGARLSFDRGLYSDRPLIALTRWRLQSSPPGQLESELRPALRQRALQLPPGYNPRTLELARQWRKEAGNDDAAIVEKALAWIQAEFAYTLITDLPGRHSVDEFLFDTQEGFCEHFSSAFVVLMRSAGIPARVVTGYVGGFRNPLGGHWVVRQMDAHAWAEVWLPDVGWTRVDPTAAVAPERIYDTIEDRLGAGGTVWARVGQLAYVGDWMRRNWNNLVLGFDARRQQQLLRPLGIERLDARQLVMLFGLISLLVLGVMAWLLARGERENDPLLRAWHRLGQRYARLGLGREPHEPALEWAQRVAEARPQVAETLLPLSQRFVRARYAGTAMDPALSADLRRHRP